MAYASTTLLQDVRNILEDNPWETTSTTTGTGATVVVPDDSKWAIGDIGEWSFSGTIGGEQFLVQDLPGSDNLTVKRGYNGTTAESHSSGDRVVKNPTYSVLQIRAAVSATLARMYPSAWKTVTSTITPDTDPSVVWYDSELTGEDATGLIDLMRGDQRYGTNSEYLGVYGDSIPGLRSLPILIAKGMPTGLVASGIGLRFPHGFHSYTTNVAVQFRVKLTDTLSGSNYADISEGLVSETVTMGTVSRLITGKEAPNVSEDARTGQSDVGAFAGVGNLFRQDFEILLQKLHMQQMAEIPPAKDQAYLPSWW